MPVPHLATGPGGPILDPERCVVDATLSHRALMADGRNTPCYRYLDLRSGGFNLASVEIQIYFPAASINSIPNSCRFALQGMIWHAGFGMIGNHK